MDDLLQAAKSVTDRLEIKDTWFMIFSDQNNVDLLIKKLSLDGNHIDYYLDRVDLPTYLLSPEILDVIINLVFVRKIQDNHPIMELKPKYKSFRYLAPNKLQYLDINLCIPLTDTLLSCCLKRAQIASTNHRYGPIGNSQSETLEQQIENFILTDRCDRIFKLAKSPIETTVNTILQENGRKIKLTRVMLGSFSNLPYRDTRYIYVIDD